MVPFGQILIPNPLLIKFLEKYGNFSNNGNTYTPIQSNLNGITSYYQPIFGVPRRRSQYSYGWSNPDTTEIEIEGKTYKISRDSTKK